MLGTWINLKLDGTNVQKSSFERSEFLVNSFLKNNVIWKLKTRATAE